MDGNPDLRTETTAARLLAEAMAEHGFRDDDISLALESETSFIEAVAATVRRIDELETLAEAARVLGLRYAERGKDLSDRRERLREALAEALGRSGAPLPLLLPEGTVGLTRTAPSALVLDEGLVPETYWTVNVVRSIDLRSVALDLRDGKQVPGAVLRNPRVSLQVRRA